MNKYIIIFSIIISSVLLPNSFKVISRQGEASVIVNEEHANTDIKNSFPDDYFSISTKEESYLVIDNGEKSIILMPRSKLTYENNKFTLDSGYIYIKSKHNDDIQMTLTKDMGIMEVVSNYPETVEVFINAGMGCLGCAAAHFENIEQGATAHGIDVDQLMEDLNAAISKEA